MSNDIENNSILNFPIRKASESFPGAKCTVQYEFVKTLQDELNLNPNEIVTILECPMGGWWKGVKNMDSKSPEIGWFPTSVLFMPLENYMPQPEKSPVIEEINKIDTNSTKRNQRSRSPSVFSKMFIKRNRSKSESYGTTPSLSFFRNMPSILDESNAMLPQSLYSKAKNIIPYDIPNDLILTIDTENSQNIKKLQSTDTLPAIAELFQTEKKFVDDLYLIQESIACFERILTSEELFSLSNNIQSIIEIHLDMLFIFESVYVCGDTSVAQIGLIFEKHAVNLLGAHMEYTRFLCKIKSKSDIMKGNFINQISLSDFILVPMQRMCRYSLLIDSIKKSVSVNESQLQNVVDCNKLILKIINSNSQPLSADLKRISDLKDIQNRVAITIDEVVYINENSRKVACYLFLCNNSLILARQLILSIKRISKLKFDIPFSDSYLKIHSNGLADISVSLNDVLINLCFKSPLERDAWMRNFNDISAFVKSTTYNTDNLTTTINIEENDDALIGSATENSNYNNRFLGDSSLAIETKDILHEDIAASDLVPESLNNNLATNYLETIEGLNLQLFEASKTIELTIREKKELDYLLEELIHQTSDLTACKDQLLDIKKNRNALYVNKIQENHKVDKVLDAEVLKMIAKEASLFGYKQSIQKMLSISPIQITNNFKNSDSIEDIIKNFRTSYEDLIHNQNIELKYLDLKRNELENKLLLANEKSAIALEEIEANYTFKLTKSNNDILKLMKMLKEFKHLWKEKKLHEITEAGPKEALIEGLKTKNQHLISQNLKFENDIKSYACKFESQEKQLEILRQNHSATKLASQEYDCHSMHTYDHNTNNYNESVKNSKALKFQIEDLKKKLASLGRENGQLLLKIRKLDIENNQLNAKLNISKDSKLKNIQYLKLSKQNDNFRIRVNQAKSLIRVLALDLNRK